MSVVQPGGGSKQRGTGQRGGSSGSPPKTRPAGQGRTDQAKTGGGRSQTGASRASSGTGTAGARSAGGQKAPGRRPSGQRPGDNRGKGRRNVPVQAAAPRRFSPAMITIGAIGVVVVVIVAFVVVKLATGSSSSTQNSQAPVLTPASPAVLSQLTSVPESVMQQVGLPGSNTQGFNQLPQVVNGQSTLTINGKPGALFIGGEFCPYCAAERWPMILAFSKFGTFSGLKETTSSPWDAYPATATFSFEGSTYTSSTIAFTPIEHESNDTGPDGQGRSILTPLTTEQNNLWSKWETHFGSQEGFPFLDIGNKLFVVTPTYSPQVLAGLDQQEIASKLSNPKDPVTQNIVGTANYLIAGICATTGQQPSSVCSMPVIQQATKQLGLS